MALRTLTAPITPLPNRSREQYDQQKLSFMHRMGLEELEGHAEDERGRMMGVPKTIKSEPKGKDRVP